MTLHGWIIYNGQLPGPKFRELAEWIQIAAAKQSSTTTIFKNDELHALLAKNDLDIIHKEQRLPDYVVFTDKDIYLAKQLELLGVRLFNSSETIAISDDKITTYQMLVANKLPVPDTIIAPKTFFNSNTVNENSIDLAINKFGFPMIVKEAFGSFGQQVYLIDNKKDLLNKVAALQGKPFMFQAFVSSSYGQDLRLHVVGDQVVAAMKRTSLNDFRANVSAGGTMEAYQPSESESKMAIAAAKAIHADFAGVDLLIGANNSPIICEVNSNAHIRNMYDCTKINVADDIIAYILKIMNGRKKNHGL
ncbi:ATP-grasp domain-containing protein [Virgibacillus sp. W0430]|uniref:ATP-grasp domain-containing protein n=1 Tax=Virgibacillus sp. W0430 TaxID=3391580 RepID=UPI003F4546D3